MTLALLLALTTFANTGGTTMGPIDPRAGVMQALGLPTELHALHTCGANSRVLIVSLLPDRNQSTTAVGPRHLISIDPSTLRIHLDLGMARAEACAAPSSGRRP